MADLKLYNTLTRRKEVFKPIKDKQVKIFVCGPTIYDYAHLGHGKTCIQFDVIVKYLRFIGYKVVYLQNLTDIDDKIIKRANEEKLGKDGWKVIKDKYEMAYLEDMKKLGVNSIDKYARATDYIPQIVSQVKRLIEKKYAYKISDGWYFDLSKDKEYGKLAKRTDLELNDSVSRIDENKEKKNKGDFCLWKFSKPEEPSWKADIGYGRPGWHIEDTAITESEFGPQYDIHGGGIDLIFPHHEAEIAQMESISGKKPLVRYWLHTGFLNISKEKMSKSKGNFKTIRELLKDYDLGTIRYLILTTNYRKPMDFSTENLDAAKNACEKLKRKIIEIKGQEHKGKDLTKEYEARFREVMNDDINTSKALEVLWNTLNDFDFDPKLKLKLLIEFDSVLGLGIKEMKEDRIEIPEEVIKLAESREKLRKDKKWAEADILRQRIKDLGYELEDSSEGFKIKNYSSVK